MATGGGDVSSFELYECQVCLMPMMERNPRMLTCHHSFCEECLAQLLKAGQICCPSCRRYTKPDENNVKNLPMNFYLLKIWERDHSQINSSSLPTCQLCKVDTAYNKCEKCVKYLCDKCKSKHDRLPGNKQHFISKICERHGDVIGHLCLQCIKAVCITCTVDHEGHIEKLVEYTKGIDDVNTQIESYIKRATSKSECLATTSKKLQDKIKTFANQKAQIEQREKYYKNELAKLKEEKREVEIKLKEHNKAAEQVNETSKDSVRIQADFIMLKKKIENSYDRYTLQRFVKLKANFEKIPKDVNKLPIQPGICVFTWEKIAHVLTVSGEKTGLFEPTVIATSDNGFLFVFDAFLKNILECDLNGKVVNNHTPEYAGESVMGISIYLDCLFVLQPSGITKYVIEADLIKLCAYKPRIQCMTKVVAINETTLLISDTDNGEVYTYSCETDATSVVLQGLSLPSSLDVTFTEHGLRFAVTEAIKNKVNIYDDQWQLVASVKVKLNSLQCSMLTANNTLLIADKLSNKISEYGLDGRLKRDLLTGKDGLWCPDLFACSHPHFWILEDNGPKYGDVTLKRYLFE